LTQKRARFAGLGTRKNLLSRGKRKPVV